MAEPTNRELIREQRQHFNKLAGYVSKMARYVIFLEQRIEQRIEQLEKQLPEVKPLDEIIRNSKERVTRNSLFKDKP